MADRENDTSQYKASMCIQTLHRGFRFNTVKSISYNVTGPTRELAEGGGHEQRSQINTPPPSVPTT